MMHLGLHFSSDLLTMLSRDSMTQKLTSIETTRQSHAAAALCALWSSVNSCNNKAQISVYRFRIIILIVIYYQTFGLVPCV